MLRTPPAPSEEEWDVDVEIARELRELAAGNSDSSLTDDETSTLPAAAAAASATQQVDALWAALAAREQLADSLTARIQELQALPHVHHSCQQGPEAASAEQVCAAVAALRQATGLQEQQLRDVRVAASAAGRQQAAAPCATAASAEHGAAPAAPNSCATLAHAQHQQPPPSPAAAEAASATAAALPPRPVKQTSHTAAAPPPDTASADQPSAAAKQQLSPPHTPNTQDKRQHAAAAAAAVQPMQMQQQVSGGPCLTPSGSSAQQAGVVAVEAAAAAVTSEAAAATAAAHQRLHEQQHLQQLLHEQAAAAAARQAAQAEARQQLQQQAELAAVSYMAAWRIAGAWQAYRSSPARAAKLSAVMTLQAAVRGAAARGLLQQMRTRHQLLAALEAAVQSGQHEAVQKAAAAAAEAGCQAEAAAAVQQYQAASQGAAQHLQQAAATGNHAAFTVALAAAERFSTNAETCAACSSSFQVRRHASAQALQAAVSALPLPQVQRAVDAALELGRPRKDLAAALEAARARDAAALARLSDAVKGLTALQSTNMLAAAAAAAPAQSDGTFDISEYLDAVAACRQLGKPAEAAAAEAALQHCRQAASRQLALAADSSTNVQEVQQLLCWCRQLDGLQQDCDAAVSKLAQRQQEMVAQLLAAAESSPAAAVHSLLQRCQALGVAPEQLAAARQQLQEQQAATQRQCWGAAKSGSLEALHQAVSAAVQQGVDAQSLDPCLQLMQGRQQQAARALAEHARGLCVSIAQAACTVADADCLLQKLLELRAPEKTAGAPHCAEQPASSVSSSSGGSSDGSRVTGSSGSCAGVGRCSLLWGQVQELRQQAAVCCGLGLQDNVAAAVAAVAQAAWLKRSEGVSMLAVCSQPLGGGLAAQATADSSGSSSSRADNTLGPHQPPCLWEEGAGVEQQRWTAQASAGSKPQGICWPQQQHVCLPQLAVGGPMQQQQQQQWTTNLQDALAEQRAAVNSPHSQQPHQQPQQQQPQQQQEAPPNWLRRLLLANAAVPLAQLSRLDLSLEQLPGLTGLGVLCPQLTWLAVNMDGLSSLQGLQGCAQLEQLSAQDNQLLALPDIWCHPKLTSLLLDSNRLASITPPHSSSSSSGSSVEAHTRPVLSHSLQVLSLANNQLANICSSARDRAGSIARGLSSWLPGLQVLRLSGNQLSNLSGLEGCSSLRTLDVSRNKLTCLQGLAGCHLLQHLDASDNKLCSFPAQALHLPLLQSLKLTSNALACWPSLPPLPHLLQLSLADNQLRLPPDLHGMLQLRTLDLGFNRLADLRACIAALQAAPQLQELELHDNAFHTQPRDDDLAWEAAVGPAEAAVFEGLYRQQVAAGLPWLLKLDCEALEPAERLAGCPLELVRLAHPQQQQGACVLAAGRLAAHTPVLSLQLLRQLRAGFLQGLGVVACAGVAAGCVAGAPQTATTRSHAAALWAAGALLPHLGRLAEAAGGCVSCSCESCVASSSNSSSVAACTTCCGPTAAQQAGCPAWLHHTEALWCVSTRAWLVQGQAWQQQQQQQQQQAATHPSYSSWLLPADATDGIRPAQHCSSATPASDAAGLEALLHLPRQHLMQQQQACRRHQQQLVMIPGFNAAAHQALRAAAVAVQCAWRGRSARNLYARQLQQQQQQQAVLGAAVVLQAAWRGRQCRQAAAAARQQWQQQQAQLTAAAAVRIQAAVRGHKVRQRLKAALAAARQVAPSKAAAGAVCTTLQQQGAAADVRMEDEDWDFDGVPEGYLVGLEDTAGLLEPDSGAMMLLPPEAAPAALSDSRAAAAPARAAQHAAAAAAPDVSESCSRPGQMPGSSAAAGAAATATAAAASSVGGSSAAGGASEGPASSLRASNTCGASSQFEVKIAGLMSEWGFTDRATAEAYYKRQKHTLKAVAKHKREEQLRDPAARLKKLQAQLGSGGSAAPLPAAAASTLSVAAPLDTHVQATSSVSHAAPAATTGIGAKRGCSGSTPRLHKQVSCPPAHSCGGADSGSSPDPCAGLFRRSSSHKQQQQPLSLPSLVLPQSSTAAPAVVQAAVPARGGLPKLLRGP